MNYSSLLEIYFKYLPYAVIVNSIGGALDGSATYDKNKNNFRNPARYDLCVLGGSFTGIISGVLYPLMIPYSVGHYLYNKFYITHS